MGSILTKHLITINKINRESIFLLGYDIFLITGLINVTLLAYTISGPITKIACVIEFVLFIFAEAGKPRWNIKEALLFIACITLFVLCYIRNPIEIAAMFLCVFCSRNYSFKKIARHTIRLSLPILAMIIILSQVGVIRDIIFEGYRHALGFRYVLYAPSILMNVVMLEVFLDGINIKKYKLIIYLIINFWLFFESYAILSFGLTSMFILWVLYYKLRKNIKIRQHKIPSFLSFSFIFFFIISFLLVYLYTRDYSGWYLINRISSGRLELMRRALDNNTINLFGNNISWVGNGTDPFGNLYRGVYYYVDNAYVCLLLEQGIIASIITWAMYIISMKKCREKDDKVLFIIFLVLSAYFVFDNLKLKLIYNTFWLALPGLILNKDIDLNIYRNAAIGRKC